MAKAKIREEWEHTSAIMAMMVNINLQLEHWIPLDAFLKEEGQNEEKQDSGQETIDDPELKRQVRNEMRKLFPGK